MPSPKKQRPQRPAPPVEVLVAIARDLLPVAAKQARQKRPRLLAVCARIILSARRIKQRADEQLIGGDTAEDLRSLK